MIHSRCLKTCEPLIEGSSALGYAHTTVLNDGSAQRTKTAIDGRHLASGRHSVSVTVDCGTTGAPETGHCMVWSDQQYRAQNHGGKAGKQKRSFLHFETSFLPNHRRAVRNQLSKLRHRHFVPKIPYGRCRQLLEMIRPVNGHEQESIGAMWQVEVTVFPLLSSPVQLVQWEVTLAPAGAITNATLKSMTKRLTRKSMRFFISKFSLSAHRRAMIDDNSVPLQAA